jgi:hypothetical protein
MSSSSARRNDRLLEPAGLTVNQFGLRAWLYGARQRGEILPMGTLAERVGMSPTTLNRSLRPLEMKGFIANTVDPGDRCEAAPGASPVARGPDAHRSRTRPRHQRRLERIREARESSLTAGAGLETVSAHRN